MRSFCHYTGVSIDRTIADGTLIPACRAAAKRYLDDKLGLEIEDSRLESADRPFYVEKHGFGLYIRLFMLRIDENERETIMRLRPYSNVRGFTLNTLAHSKDRHTQFLKENFDAISAILKRLLTS